MNNVYTKKINLGLINQVNEFTNFMMFNCSSSKAIIKSGRYVVDAKSIMGVFSLNLSEPVTLEITWEDTIDEAFIQKFEDFCKEKNI